MSRASRVGVAAPRRRVRIEASAKLNLGLAVGPARSDGFHDLATVFQSISLADTLMVEPRARGFSLTVRFEDARARRPAAQSRSGIVTRPRSRSASPSRASLPAMIGAVPRGGANLVLRAARLLASRYGLPGGAHLTLVKRIPAGAGLGGGSADAAAAIVGLARLHGLRLRLEECLALGAELGSDVPFALLGGTALGFGRGERLSPLRLAQPFRAMLAVPSWRISTVGAFRRLDGRKYGLTRWKAKLRFTQSLGREAITVKRARRLGNSFEEVLHERRSEFLSLCARLRRAGVEEPHLTGSGSAVFGTVPTGLPGKRVVERFAGNEAIYLVRSKRTGLTHTTLP